jgi:hypothetical protein
VLGRQVSPAVHSRSRDREATRLAARDAPTLEHDDLEAALDQLVCGREAGNPTPEHRDPYHSVDGSPAQHAPEQARS